MEFLADLKHFFEEITGSKAEAIRLDELPDGMDNLDAIILGNYYTDAFEKGLFSEHDEESLKTHLRNLKLRHGDDVFSEDRIEATIQCIRQACSDFAQVESRIVHAKTRAIVSEVPEIWR